MDVTLKTGLWLTADGVVSVTRNISTYDPKGVVGQVVKGNDGKWRIRGDSNNREYSSAESAAAVLLASLPPE